MHLPAIFAYRATQMRSAGRDDARVPWEGALADWVVANLFEVAYYSWDGRVLHFPDAMLSYFQHVELD